MTVASITLEPPFVRELNPVPDIGAALHRVARLNDPLLMESSLRSDQRGRYSFLMAEPRRTFRIAEPVYGTNPFSEVRAYLETRTATRDSTLPPFQGGAAGLLSYELGGSFERLPREQSPSFHLPAAVIHIYDWLLAWDHLTGKCWFLGRPLPRDSGDVCDVSPDERFRMVCSLLAESPRPARSTTSPRGEDDLELPRCPLPGHDGVFSNFDRENYEAAVQRVVDYICAGDLFQANLSQVLYQRAPCDPLSLYLHLREQNPAPFSAYFGGDEWAVLSSSPERFLQVEGRTVWTRPIKGTRQRRRTPEADLYTRDELRESGKDHAENVMIVDLLRNDLSRVCRPGSIRVPELCSVESYETVTHLVSEVVGELEPDKDFWDTLAATFPGGSITGAPKIRAMEVIRELERVDRGPYCGSLFYCGFDGTADSSILIRTLTQHRGWVRFPVGGGIIARSNPRDEYEETLHKAAGMLRALRACSEDSARD